MPLEYHSLEQRKLHYEISGWEGASCWVKGRQDCICQKDISFVICEISTLFLTTLWFWVADVTYMCFEHLLYCTAHFNNVHCMSLQIVVSVTHTTANLTYMYVWDSCIVECPCTLDSGHTIVFYVDAYTHVLTFLYPTTSTRTRARTINYTYILGGLFLIKMINWNGNGMGHLSLEACRSQKWYDCQHTCTRRSYLYTNLGALSWPSVRLHHMRAALALCSTQDYVSTCIHAARPQHVHFCQVGCDPYCK